MRRAFTSHSREETRELGARLARALFDAVGDDDRGAVVALVGELGAGKTTFVQGAAEWIGVRPGPGPAAGNGAGESEGVTSPTFVLVREHEGADGRRLVHVDAYRLRSGAEFRDLGSDDFLPSGGPGGRGAGRGVAFVEWAEKVEEALPRPYLVVRFRHEDESGRSLEVEGVGEGAEALVEAAARALASDGTTDEPE